MPVRSIVAAIIALAFLVTGAVLLAARDGATFSEFFELLRLRRPDASLLCVLAGWGAVVAGLLALLSAAAAFVEDDDSDGFRRRGFPKAFPVIFVLISLALFRAALQCAALATQIGVGNPLAAPAETPIEAPSPEPDTEPASEAELDVVIEAPATPAIATFAAPLQWEYMYPLIHGDTYVRSPSMKATLANLFPTRDPYSDVRRMLCGKAWVAFAGAASEEGPRERNERRARVRAELVTAAANAWLDAHDADCPRPIVLGVNFGQHSATAETASLDGAHTGYQRQLLIASRERASPGEIVDRDDAVGELHALLADEADLQAMLAGRRYAGDPQVFLP